jgi:diguanylate cyclase (GGDEF)-like protein/PAS domain S-box-containing protein
VHKLFAKHLSKATKSSGEVDLDLLGQLVSMAYEEADRDRRRTDRSIKLMIDELDQLNRNLEKVIAERTSKLREREAELRAQNQRFDAAINNMAQALCMFDRDKRLVVCNTQYAKMYGLSDEQVKPGTALQSILEHRVISGNSPENTEQYIQDRLDEVDRGEPYQAINRLRDGRIVSVVHQPMASGGWVALHQDVTEQKRIEEKIAYMAHHDALTGLPNRVLLRQELNRRLNSVERGESLAVFCLDLDYFKQVNDAHGHPLGDALLCAVGRRLCECVRDTDVVARLGGDEFAIVQSGMEQPVSAQVLAQKFVDAIALPFNVEGHEIVIGVSIGIAVAPNDTMDADYLLKSADLALYRAKELGRNGFSFFETQMDADVRERHALEGDLRNAIAEGEFELFYQPIINIERNTICSFEALVRWNHPTRGMILPTAFIPVAEESGLIVALGEWVLRQACEQAKNWPDDIRIAINLSPVQFRNNALEQTLISAIATAGIAPSRVELEITEAILLQNAESIIATLHRLRDLGVRICMDDFGSGYSSLNYLRSFPFDKIKIDKSFIFDIEKNNDAVAIVQAVVGLGNSLGMTTTAEGVETKEQLDLLRAEGCTEVQGYLFSKPQAASEVPRLLSVCGRTRRVAA